MAVVNKAQKKSYHDRLNILQTGETWTYVILIAQGGVSHG
jgi:hypothetical protein